MLPVINQLKPDEIVAKSSFKPFDNIKIKNKTKRPLGFPCSTAARVTAGVQVRSLAWDLPHAMRRARRKKKTTKIKKMRNKHQTHQQEKSPKTVNNKNGKS